MATFNGTNGNDSFYGGTIFTGVDDIAKGLAGNDTLFGGNGKDKLYGGSDNDHLNGGNNEDELWGGSGSDRLYGDKWVNQSGRMTEVAPLRSGDDKLYGGSGNDQLFGLAGNDYINGEEDNDWLDGGSGTNTLKGGSGDDVLFSRANQNGDGDTLTGGSGYDAFIIGGYSRSASQGASHWADFGTSVAQNAALDVLSAIDVPIANTAVNALFGLIDAAASGGVGEADGNPIKITDFDPTEDFIVVRHKAGQDINVTPTQRNGNPSVDIELGDGSNGSLLSVTGDLFKADKVDLAQFQRTQIVISGDKITRDGKEISRSTLKKILGNDELLQDLASSDENISLFGAYGPQIDKGTRNNDSLRGTKRFGDELHGNDGEDQLYGLGGEDRLYGGGGNDFLYGGEGSDTASYIDALSGIRINLSKTENDTNGTYAVAEDGFGTEDKLFSIENVTGSEHDDWIAGDDKDNVLNGGGGNDRLYGGEGNDTLTGGYGFEYLDGGAGNDTVKYDYYDGGANINLSTGRTVFTPNSKSYDTLVSIENVVGSHGNDIITGDSEKNILHGGSGSDTLVGGAGDDVLYGSKSYSRSSRDYDTLTGGEGADTFVLGRARGSHYLDYGFATITDFNRSQLDKIQVHGSTSNYKLTHSGDDTIIGEPNESGWLAKVEGIHLVRSDLVTA